MHKYNVIQQIFSTGSVSYYNAIIKKSGIKVVLQKFKKFVPERIESKNSKVLLESSMAPQLLDYFEQKQKNFYVFPHFDFPLTLAMSKCLIGNKLKQKIIIQLINIVTTLHSKFDFHLHSLNPSRFFLKQDQLFILTLQQEEQCLRFSSPEQVQNRPTSSDSIFALGCIIVQLLTEEPFVKSKTPKQYSDFYDQLLNHKASQNSFQHLIRTVIMDPLDVIRIKHMIVPFESRVSYENLLKQWDVSTQAKKSQPIFFKLPRAEIYFSDKVQSTRRKVSQQTTVGKHCPYHGQKQALKAKDYRNYTPGRAVSYEKARAVIKLRQLLKVPKEDRLQIKSQISQFFV